MSQSGFKSLLNWIKRSQYDVNIFRNFLQQTGLKTFRKGFLLPTNLVFDFIFTFQKILTLMFLGVSKVRMDQVGQVFYHQILSCRGRVSFFEQIKMEWKLVRKRHLIFVYENYVLRLIYLNRSNALKIFRKISNDRQPNERMEIVENK